MALNTSKCNHLTPLPFKGLISDGVVAATKQYCLQALSKHGERGRRSNICRQTIPHAGAGNRKAFAPTVLGAAAFQGVGRTTLFGPIPLSPLLP